MKHKRFQWTIVLPALSLMAFCAPAQSPMAEAEVQRILQLYDKNHDGKLDAAELSDYILKEKSPYKALKPDGSGKVNFDDIKKQAVNDANKIEDRYGDVNSSLDQQGIKTALLPKEDSKGFFDVIGNVVRFRKSFLSAATEAQPANFSWTKTPTNTSFSVDAALGLQPIQLYETTIGKHELVLEIAPSVEGHVSSDPKASQNSISARIPFDFREGLTANYVKDAWLPSQYFTVTPVYETDKSWKTKTISLQPLYTPNIPKLGIGSFLPLVGARTNALVYLRWRPYVGFDIGRVLDSGGNASLRAKADYWRFYSQAHGELWITDQFLLAADIYDRLLLNGNGKNYVYAEISPTLYVDTNQRFSVGITYKNGKTTPAFNEVHSLNLWAGIKF
jgi:Ca2+-binding EF-hand superfamily protein